MLSKFQKNISMRNGWWEGRKERRKEMKARGNTNAIILWKRAGMRKGWKESSFRHMLSSFKMPLVHAYMHTYIYISLALSLSQTICYVNTRLNYVQSVMNRLESKWFLNHQTHSYNNSKQKQMNGLLMIFGGQHMAAVLMKIICILFVFFSRLHLIIDSFIPFHWYGEVANLKRVCWAKWNFDVPNGFGNHVFENLKRWDRFQFVAKSNNNITTNKRSFYNGNKKNWWVINGINVARRFQIH